MYTKVAMTLIMQEDLALLSLSFSPKSQTGLPLRVPDWLDFKTPVCSFPYQEMFLICLVTLLTARPNSSRQWPSHFEDY
jgi:hypothetical protein